MKYFACTYAPIDYNLSLLLTENELLSKLSQWHSFDIIKFKNAYKKLFSELWCDVKYWSWGYFVVPNKLWIDVDIFYLVKWDNNWTCYICWDSKFIFWEDFIDCEL